MQQQGAALRRTSDLAWVTLPAAHRMRSSFFNFSPRTYLQKRVRSLNQALAPHKPSQTKAVLNPCPPPSGSACGRLASSQAGESLCASTGLCQGQTRNPHTLWPSHARSHSLCHRGSQLPPSRSHVTPTAQLQRAIGAAFLPTGRCPWQLRFPEQQLRKQRALMNCP